VDNTNYKLINISDRVIRRDYSKLDVNFEEPKLLEIQMNSYQRFLHEELRNVITSVEEIHSYRNKYTIKFNDIFFAEPKRTEEQAKNDSKTYEMALFVYVILLNNETGEIIKPKRNKKNLNEGIFFANIPLMTKKGTFIINGIEKFVIAQIVRSPSVYALSKSQIKLNSFKKKIIENNVCEVLPSKGILMVSTVDDSKNISTFTMRDISGESTPCFNSVELLRACGLSIKEIRNIFDGDEIIETTILNSIYNPETIMEQKGIELLVKEINQNPKIYLEKINRSHKLERKLKTLIYDFVINNNEIDEILETVDNLKEEPKKEAKKKMIRLNADKKALINKIIVEKSAKDIAYKMSLSLKMFDNTIKVKNEEDISYRSLLLIYFCNKRYYDLTEAGRYKFNRKLRLSERLYRKIIAEDILDKSGEVVFKKGTIFNKQNLDLFKEMSTKNELAIEHDINLTCKLPVRVLDNHNILTYEKVKIYINNDNLDDNDVTNIIGVSTDNKVTQLTLPDFISIISYSINLTQNIGDFDDIDHLGNKRLKLIHELLRNKITVAMLRIEKFIKEKLAVIDGEVNDKIEQKKPATVRQILNSKPFQLIIKEFFNSHPLIQFIDQQNPLAELTNKRRISAMGPNGISREDPNLDIRDVHYSHYGRICPIETPEGMNIGLVMSLASFTKIDERGFILTPYRKVENGFMTNDIKWFTASQDDEYIIAEPNVQLDKNQKIIQETVVARYRGQIDIFNSTEIDYIDILPKQVVSIAASSVPFLENNDANRALMGANMQRQATPLIRPYAPIVGTGSEYKIAHDSGMAVISDEESIVDYVDGNKIIIKNKKGKSQINLIKFKKTNQDTCNNQIPLINVGDKVKESALICDGPAMRNGELALGQNILVGFTTWSGYNYEDAIILSERLVNEDIYTSISIDKYTIKCMVTKNGDEEITRELPNVGEISKKYLDEDGIIMVGAFVKDGDILVGKTTPKSHKNLTPEEKLLQAIFGEKTKQVKDSSLRLNNSYEGIVGAVKRFRNSTSEDLGDDVIEIIEIFIFQKRKIQIGDKMAGRHGNKGIISKIVPIEDMPHLEDGTPLDIMLNPLGVPSRMNIGQILEMHLGYAAREIGKKELIKLVMNEENFMPLQRLFSLTDSIALRLYNLVKEHLENENIKTIDQALKEIKSIDIEIILNKLGLSYSDIGFKVITPVFDGCTRNDLEKTMIEAGIDPIKTKGKFPLIDGRTGEYFNGDISIGVIYMLKLDHMVDDKIHSRAVGPYSKITQQPLGGKSQNGGQRFGEMEVWALEAYGAAYNLKEILTIKSDDVRGRNWTYNAIIKGKEIPAGHLPESFKLLIKQLQGLCLYTGIINEEGKEIDTDEYIKAENLSTKQEELINEQLQIYLNDEQEAMELGFTKPVIFDDNEE